MVKAIELAVEALSSLPAADQERMARAAIEQLGNESVAHRERQTRTPHLKPLKLKD